MKTTDIPFRTFPKIPRFNREIVITEKIDGTNAQICIGKDGQFLVGCRTRWLTKQDHNHGFWDWAMANKDALLQLGPGRHFGEWWGYRINRGYGLKEKRFSLFHPERAEQVPTCCFTVPVLYRGLPMDVTIQSTLYRLKNKGSQAALGFTNPEGIVIYHTASGHHFKLTLEDDDPTKIT